MPLRPYFFIFSLADYAVLSHSKADFKCLSLNFLKWEDFLEVWSIPLKKCCKTGNDPYGNKYPNFRL